MNKVKVYKLLEVILEEIPKDTNWHLDGSVNLLVQGINLQPNDLDISTDDKGIEIFRSTFDKFIIDNKYGEKVSGRTLLLKIKGEEVEINSYGDKELTKFDSVEIISWNDLQIPVLPLKEAKDFYSQIEREEKVRLITNFLKNNNLE